MSNWIRLAEMHYERLANEMASAGYVISVQDVNKYDVAISAYARFLKSLHEGG